MPIALRLFFKKIFISNKQNIPVKGPVILASMHPNSFIDDFVLGIFSGRKLRFLARGDVFKSKIARVLLESMRVSPVYRAMDNVKDVKKNIEAFNIYTKTLEKKETLLIHSEGICVHEKRVRRLKKGTARIAFGAEQKNDFKLGVKIVPISLNYTNSPKIRENIMIECAEPILVSDYKDLYLKNPAKAIKAINEDIFKALHEGAIVIEEKETIQTSEHCLKIVRNNKAVSALPIAGNKKSPFRMEKAVCDKVNELYHNKKEDFEKLKLSTEKYFNVLKEHGIKDREVSKSKTPIIIQSLFLILISPIFILSYLLHVGPVILGRKIADKVVKTVEFYGSVFLGAAWLFLLIQYLILFNTLGLLFGITGIACVIALAIAGFWSVLIRDQYLMWFDKFRFLKFKSKHADLFTQLKVQRKNIIQLLQL